MTATQLSPRWYKLISRGGILLTVGVHILLMLTQKEALSTLGAAPSPR